MLLLDDDLEHRAPPLPEPRGELTTALIAALTADGPTPGPEAVAAAHDVLEDDDIQLALYLCYELHYRGLKGVDPALEWDPGLLALRAALEQPFAAALAASAPARDDDPIAPEEVGRRLFSWAAADAGPSLSRFVETRADIAQVHEFMIHRSAYQLKEADPHTWAIPRLAGSAKAALVEVQADEYGSGRVDRMHSRLYAKAMRAVGLDDTYGAYLDLIPGITLATVNMISFWGLHRRWRGALTGHLAMFEITSAIPNRRYGNALRRLGLGAEATDFFDEHVEADSVHENIAAYDLAEGLARAEPDLMPDILFGARALLAVEGRWGGHLLDSWAAGETSLRRAPEGVAPPASVAN